ncbi:MAG TPA: peptidylprolyl isomerase [Blastocatellia bacterium]|nr:peptidylprolyl isomerase [Blastocatellia bacterium]
MKRGTVLIICLLLAGAAAACRKHADNSPVIATVNGEEVTRAEFERFVATKLGEVTGGDAADMLRSQMLDEYLRRRVVLREAERAGLAVAEVEIEQAAQENPQLRAMAADGASREEMRRDMLVEKYYRQVVLRDVRVTGDEAQHYIEQNQSRLTDTPGFLVREIRVQTRDEAERLRREVTEGKRDFAAVARLHSDAPNAEAGGLSRYDEGQLPDVLEKAIQPLRPGDVSQVVESGYGFHLFKLEQRIQPHAPEERRAQLDDRRAHLTEELIARKNQQAVDAALAGLLERADIQIRDAALGFTYMGQLRHN